MHAAAQKIARALISHSPFHRCARKISRFARNDDAGKALLSFSACLRRISPLSFVPPVPYPPLWGTFPSRGRLWVWGSGILVSPPSPGREGSWTSPSFLWKEVPRRGGGWLPQRDEGEYTIVRPLVSSSRAQPRDLSCRSGVRHACGCSENRSGAHLTLSVSPVCKEDFSLCSK